MILGLVCWFGFLNAEAGGYYFPDSGVIASGRGGAVVAGSRDQFAQYYNPAGLIRIRRPTLSVGLSAIKQNISFTRRTWGDDPRTEEEEVDEGSYSPGNIDGQNPYSYDVEKNQGRLNTIPQFGFAAPVHKMVVVAFGMTSPFAPKYKYTPNGPQRFSIIQTQIQQFQFGPSIAVQPIKYFTIGASFQWQILTVLDRLKASSSYDEGYDGDIIVEAKVKDMFTPSFNAGLLVEPIEQISIGFSVQPPIKFKAKGTGTLDFTGNSLAEALHFGQDAYVDDDIRFSLDMPLFLRTGIAVRPIAALEIEADFVWEDWSYLKKLEVTDIDITVTNEEGDPIDVAAIPDSIQLPANFKDMWSIRLGAEYRINRFVDVRMGGMFEKSSLDSSGTTAALPDSDNLMGSVGTSIHILDDRLTFDLFGSVVGFKTMEINDSRATRIYVGVAKPEDDPDTIWDEAEFYENHRDSIERPIGNGTIKSFGYAFGGAIQWKFGKTMASL